MLFLSPSSSSRTDVKKLQVGCLTSTMFWFELGDRKFSDTYFYLSLWTPFSRAPFHLPANQTECPTTANTNISGPLPNRTAHLLWYKSTLVSKIHHERRDTLNPWHLRGSIITRFHKAENYYFLFTSSYFYNTAQLLFDIQHATEAIEITMFKRPSNYRGASHLFRNVAACGPMHTYCVDFLLTTWLDATSIRLSKLLLWFSWGCRSPGLSLHKYTQVTTYGGQTRA